MRQRVLLCACLLLLAGAPRVMARAYTVEDLLATESIGRVQIDPTARWLVIEHRRPWKSAPRFDLGGQINTALTELLRVDLQTSGAPTPLLADPQEGYLAGPFAPDGSKMVVYRLRGRALDVGVLTLDSGAARWLAITPELPVYGRAAQWRNSNELLIIARHDSDQPRHLSMGWEVQERLPRLWAAAAKGDAVTVSAIGSGQYRDLRAKAPPGRLLSIDVETGAQSILATGEFVDLEISRGGRHVAVIENLEEMQPSAADRAYIAFPTRRRGLLIIDLKTHAATRPAAQDDLALGLLAWAPRREELLVAMRRPKAGWNGRALLRIDAAGGKAAPVALGSLTPALSENREGAVFVRADWLAGDPLVFAQAPSGRADWYRMMAKGPLRLTGDLQRPSRNLVALSDDSFVLPMNGKVWRIDAKGRATRLPYTSPRQAPGQDGGTRLRENPRLGPGLNVPSAGRPGLELGENLLATGDVQVRLLRQASGVRTLSLADKAGTRDILNFNAAMTDVEPAEILRIRHAGPQGTPVTSWLYLPPHRRPGARLPLVVIPYRGMSFPEPGRHFESGELNTFMNAQVLVGAGYAVLTPSLPYDEAEGAPTANAARDILLAVDAALARPDLDPERIALFGQSFGALTAVAAASQSPRFKSVIAASGVHDEISNWSQFPLHTWVVPEDGAPAMGPMGKVESAQAHLMAPPWAEPQRYLQASNLFAADKIDAPVLIIHGDLDDLRAGQAQALFSALYRQGKDAALLTYWGEGHALAGPANIRDLYASILEWLAITLPSGADVPPPPSGAPRLRPRPRS